MSERLVIDLPEDIACQTIAVTLADLEADCSKSWPDCPRRPRQVVCDCHLRALRVVAMLKATQGRSA